MAEVPVPIKVEVELKIADGPLETLLGVLLRGPQPTAFEPGKARGILLSELTSAMVGMEIKTGFEPEKPLWVVLQGFQTALSLNSGPRVRLQFSDRSWTGWLDDDTEIEIR